MHTARRTLLGLAALGWPLLAAVGWPGTAVVQASPSIRADFNGDGVDDLAIGVVGENNNAGGVNIIYGQMSTGLSPLGNQFFSQANSFVPASPEAGDNCGAALAAGDFNGDGLTDLAMGCPGENTNAGGVIILYGSAGFGLTDAGSQVFSQNTPGIPDTEEPGDQCGAALATGDFNGDGTDDLTVGCFGEDVGSVSNAGAVFILYGAAGSGLTANGSQFFHQATPSVPNTLDAAEADDLCGRALAAGDFNGDGVDDLAIGCPGEDVGFVGNAGAVNVLYGAAGSGLTTSGSQFLFVSIPSFGRSAQAGALCGSALTAGDFSGDGVDDLAFGCPTWDTSFEADVGAVAILHGTAGGVLTAIGGIGFSVFGNAFFPTNDFTAGSDKQVMLYLGFLAYTALILKVLQNSHSSVSITSVALPAPEAAPASARQASVTRPLQCSDQSPGQGLPPALP